MNRKSWPNRLYALDVSRGFAALSVVLWHWRHFAFTGTSLGPDFVPEKQPLYGVLRMFYEQGVLAVPYFFLLSGFIFFWLYRGLIENKQISPRTFFVQRFSRLYPLQLMTLLIVAVLQRFYISRENDPFVYGFNDPYHFFLNLVFASNWGFESGDSFNGPNWSVSIEILLYIVFFIVVFYRQGWWLFSLSVSIIALFLSFFNYRIFIGLALFFLGGVVFDFTVWISRQNRFWRLPIYWTTIIVWILVIINFYSFDLSRPFHSLGIAGELFLFVFPNFVLFPFTVCSLALLEIDNGPFLKPVSWVGDITYSSYMLHFPIELVFGLAISLGVLDSGSYTNTWCFLIYFLMLISLSYFVYRKFERPMQTIIRNHTSPKSKEVRH